MMKQSHMPMTLIRRVAAVLPLAFAAASLAARGAPSRAEVVADTQSAACEQVFPDGRLLVDFGRAAFGWAELDLPAGEYTVRLGEKLGTDGMIDMRPGGAIRAAEVAFVSCGTIDVSAWPSAAAQSMGLTERCGREPWPPLPWMTMSQVSAEAMKGPFFQPIVPAGI